MYTEVPSIVFAAKSADRQGRKTRFCYITKRKKNTKIEIRPILSYGGSFPSHLVCTVKLRVRISSVTDIATLRRGYRALLNVSPSTPLE